MTQSVPAFLLARTSVRNVAQAAMQGIVGAQPPRVSIAGNRFTLFDAAGNSRQVTITGQDGRQYVSSSLRCVIIDANQETSKVFFEGDYDSVGDNSPPTCFSDNGTAPSSQAAKPQALQCNVCQWNAWGSKINAQGKQVKACNDKKKLAVIIPGDPMVYQFQIPPASLKNLRGCMAMIAQQSLGPRNADITDVVTEIEFESQGVLKFTPVEFINEAIAAQIEAAAQDQIKLDMIVGRNDVPYRGQIAAAPAVAQITQQPAPQVQPPGAGLSAPAPAAPMQTPTTLPVGSGGPVQAEQPKRSRGRPRAAEAAPVQQAQTPVHSYPQASPQPVAQPQPALAVPPSAGAPSFLQQAQPAPAPQPVAQQTVAPPQQNFGIVQDPPKADAALLQAVNDAFKLPT